MENLAVGIVFIAVLLFIAFLLVVIFTERPAEAVEAAVTRRRRRTGDIAGLTAKMYLSLAAFLFTLVFVGFYWLTEEDRMRSAEAHQISRALERGAHTFATNCVLCHGNEGQGLIGPSLQLGEVANRLGLDLSNPVDQAKLETYIRNTIMFGWPPTYRGEKPRMPAWSDKAGGTLNDEQIYELVTLIQNGQSWEEVKQVAEASAPGAAPKEAPAADPIARGKQLYNEKGCIACHGRNLEGGVGPKLTQFKDKPQIATVLPNNEENLKKWLQNPPAVKPGTGMPNLNLKPDEIDALTQFLMSQ